MRNIRPVLCLAPGLLTAAALSLALPDIGRAAPPAQDAPAPTQKIAGQPGAASQSKQKSAKKKAARTPGGKSKKSPSKAGGSAPEERVAATVSFREHRNMPVFAAEVWRLVRSFQGRGAAGPVSSETMAQLVRESVHREIVALHLQDAGLMPPAKEIDVLLEEFKQQLAKQQIDATRFLAAQGTTVAALRKQLAWDSAWSKYVSTKVGADAIAAHFESHRRDFDGTEIRVSHILFRVDKAPGQEKPDESAWQAAAEKAKAVRQEIAEGKIAFADAARKYSDGPSKDQGGDLGFVPRHERMHETFSAAAFALEKDKVSEPVASPFGMHLILCTDVRPGEKAVADVRDEIARTLARNLFKDLAASLAPEAKVEYADVLPHFDPATGAVVEPSTPYVPPEGPTGDPLAPPESNAKPSDKSLPADPKN